MNKNTGAIGTFLSIATLIAITIFTFVTASINTNLSLKQTKSSNAEEVDKTATASATPTVTTTPTTGNPTATPVLVCRQDQHNPYVTICVTPSPTPNRTITTTPTVTPTSAPAVTCTRSQNSPYVTTCVTPTPTRNLTVTPTPIGGGRRVTMGNPNGVDIDLKIKLRLQGIISKPADRLNKISMKVTIVDTNPATAGYRVGTNEADFVATDDGTFSGTVKFADIAARDGYYLLVKGPKHVQKRICNRYPTEISPGVYDCEGTLAFAAGENIFNLSNIYMMSGDLPIQNGSINAEDFGNIVNGFGRLDYTSLQDGDVNLDGVINSQDYSLMMQTLKDTDGKDQD